MKTTVRSVLRLTRFGCCILLALFYACDSPGTDNDTTPPASTDAAHTNNDTNVVSDAKPSDTSADIVVDPIADVSDHDALAGEIGEPPPRCANAQLDEGEADIDCGGDCDTKCPPNARCTIDADCHFGTCSANGRCESCNDGVHNGSESDVDCGKDCPIPCWHDLGCHVDEDCFEPGFCSDGRCVATCENGKKDGTEAGIDCGGACATGPLRAHCDKGAPCNLDTDCPPTLTCLQPASVCWYPKCSCDSGEKECGPDGCGGSCGGCSAGHSCQLGKCVCMQSNCDPPKPGDPLPPPTLKGKPCNISQKIWTCENNIIYRCDYEPSTEFQQWLPSVRCNEPNPECLCAYFASAALYFCTFGGEANATKACSGTTFTN